MKNAVRNLPEYLKLLVELERKTHLRFKRVNENTIRISWPGYTCKELEAVEQELLKLGLKYDIYRTAREWVPAAGMTFTHFKEPKAA